MTTTHRESVLAALLQQFPEEDGEPPTEDSPSFDSWYHKRILSLQPSQTAQLFRTLWAGTQRQFCEEYKINAGNFSRWLGGKKNSRVSIKAAQSFLLYGHPPNAKDDEMGELPLRACSIEQAIARVTAFLAKPSVPQALIFVDGDHAANKISELEMLTPLSSVHVIVVMARGKTEPGVLGAHSPWTTLVSTKTKGKNAADQAICWMASRLSGGPLAQRRKDVLVAVVSGDAFAEELLAMLRLDGQRAYHVSRERNIAAWLLVHHEDMLSSEPQKVLLLRQLLREIATEAEPCGTVLQYMDVAAKLANERFESHNITLRGVRSKDFAYELAAGRTVWPSSPPSRLPFATVPFIPSSLSDEELRLEYEFRWRGSHASFCSRYGVDKPSFNAWRHRRVRHDPKSAEAVRQWSANLENGNESTTEPIRARDCDASVWSWKLQRS